ncbi:hypothetical protein ASPZODRAFT_60451 [Penicilliopsis zonata CBS 506.65]|uniref:FAD-binding domain-containing protein n=1 Tax=Penicilliopsis zonata CBS 506.65 TaxID=1073090 RepID=A0A1L9SQU2_9EURO|nr:hypothetical protein ASPZODRAFT_60451 [Penicilliopsis zonata CBS 506.65]OJJ49486.1 hypothetical protein ASPZODRAFT_60451 [Penicilliopsis zonata CBS 506.65]
MSIKVAIIGAGPAGCMLARLLLPHPNIQVTVFESEPSINYRHQGGTLDLHEKTGLHAVREAGLYDEFLTHARFDGESFHLCDERLKTYIKMDPATENSSRGRPEIDRSALRQMLAESLPKDMLRWGHKLHRVRDDSDSHRRTLEFADGTTASGFDLIVGAEGAWSKVRSSCLSKTKPEYSGIGGFSLSIPDAETTAPECHALVNRGSLFAYSTGQALLVQQLGDGSIQVNAWKVRPEGWEKKMMTGAGDGDDYWTTDGPTVRESIKRDCQAWAPELVELVEKATDDTRLSHRSLYHLPVGFRWDHRAGVTLLGDAAHVMCPFTGEGVNHALEDAVALSHAIIAAAATAAVSPTDDMLAVMDRGLIKYEYELAARSAVFTKRVHQVTRLMFFTEGAPGSVIERFVLQNMKTMMPSALYMAAYPLTVASVYGYYFFHKRREKRIDG